MTIHHERKWMSAQLSWRHTCTHTHSQSIITDPTASNVKTCPALALIGCLRQLGWLDLGMNR